MHKFIKIFSDRGASPVPARNVQPEERKDDRHEASVVMVNGIPGGIDPEHVLLAQDEQAAVVIEEFNLAARP